MGNPISIDDLGVPLFQETCHGGGNCVNFFFKSTRSENSMGDFLESMKLGCQLSQFYVSAGCSDLIYPYFWGKIGKLPQKTSWVMEALL